MKLVGVNTLRSVVPKAKHVELQQIALNRILNLAIGLDLSVKFECHKSIR